MAVSQQIPSALEKPAVGGKQEGRERWWKGDEAGLTLMREEWEQSLMGHLCQFTSDGYEVRKMDKLPRFFMPIDCGLAHKAVTSLTMDDEGCL